LAAKVARLSRKAGRLSREDWLAAARAVFVATGIDEVKIDRLARELQVTRGSFYWHFSDLDDLRKALLDDWCEHNTRELARIRSAWDEGVPELLDVGAAWLAERASDFPVFSSAVRDWARKDAAVAPRVQVIDRAWLTLLEQPFVAAGMEQGESEVRARLLYYHRIGYHALPLDESLAELCALQEHFTRVLLGRELDELQRRRVQQVMDAVPG